MGLISMYPHAIVTYPFVPIIDPCCWVSITYSPIFIASMYLRYSYLDYANPCYLWFYTHRSQWMTLGPNNASTNAAWPQRVGRPFLIFLFFFFVCVLVAVHKWGYDDMNIYICYVSGHTVTPSRICWWFRVPKVGRIAFMAKLARCWPHHPDVTHMSPGQNGLGCFKSHRRWRWLAVGSSTQFYCCVPKPKPRAWMIQFLGQSKHILSGCLTTSSLLHG